MSYSVPIPSSILKLTKGMVLAIAGIGSFIASATAADDFKVMIDEAQLIRLPAAGAEVIVGNPSIADISVQSSKLLIVTGKSFGFTNLIVLDADSKEILSQKISVVADSTRVVTLRKGIMRYSLHCTPDCQSPLVVGDDPKHFDILSKSNQNKFSAAGAAAGYRQSGRQ